MSGKINPPDPRLADWATPRQREYLEAIATHGSMYRAAKMLGVTVQAIDCAMNALKRSAARRGYAPEADMHKATVEPFVVAGVSTLYDDLGNQKLQWVKTRVDDRLLEQAVRAAVAELAQSVKRAAPARPPTRTQAHLANLYTLTDVHVGMRAWAPETGADWDLSIAEKMLTGAFRHLVASAPPAGIAFINQLGDWLHYDSMTAITPLHGNVLDADGRYEKVVQVAVRILRFVVDLALARHDRVVVLMAEGNHDMASSVWLRHLFSLLYENEPRVEVMDSPLPYYAWQHGSTMLAFHHGHLSKNDQLPLLFASQFANMWGATTRRYCHTGHRHHVEEKEHGGMTVVQHPTLAARDAYAARGGWVANRSMTAITYHTRHGKVASTTVVPEMLEDAPPCPTPT